MKTVDVPMDKLREAPWNANVMDRRTGDRLRESVSRYGLVQPLVIRPVAESAYETLSGNQRLRSHSRNGVRIGAMRHRESR